MIPLYGLPEKNCTPAQMSDADKSQLSHRARAAAQLRLQLGVVSV